MTKDELNAEFKKYANAIDKEYQIVKILDMGKFLLFIMRHKDVPKGQVDEWGTQFPALDKRTHKWSWYDISEDFTALHNAKEIKLTR